MIGGGLALSSHGTKAATRAALNLIPEPVTNIVASIVEDIIAIVAIFIAVFAPLLALFLLVCAVIVTALLLPRIIRVMKRSFARVRKLFTRGRASAY